MTAWQIMHDAEIYTTLASVGCRHSLPAHTAWPDYSESGDLLAGAFFVPRMMREVMVQEHLTNDRG